MISERVIRDTLRVSSVLDMSSVIVASAADREVGVTAPKKNDLKGES